MKDFTKESTAAGKLFDRLSSREDKEAQASPLPSVEDACNEHNEYDTHDTHDTNDTHETHNTYDVLKLVSSRTGAEVKSRRVSLLLTPTLHAAASEQAYRERKSLNELICDLLAEYVEKNFVG